MSSTSPEQESDVGSSNKPTDSRLLDPPREVKLTSDRKRSQESNGMASKSESPREPQAASSAKPVASERTTPSDKPASANATSNAKTTSADKLAAARTSSNSTDKSVKRMIGPFLLDKKLGVGGMGIVYRATYMKNGADVALKVLPASLKQDMAAYSGCVGGAAVVTELHRMLVEAGFERVRVTPKPESAAFIREWFPGNGFEDYVASAIIEALKPE